jgi:hypothetical protein
MDLPASRAQRYHSADGVPGGWTMDGIISGLVNGIVVPIANVIGWAAENGVLFLVFLALWIGFGVALVWSQGSLDDTWRYIQSLPLLVQLVAWLLFLPVMAGLWIWETTWPFLVRLTLVGGVAAWNLLVFLPKALQAAPH